MNDSSSEDEPTPDGDTPSEDVVLRVEELGEIFLDELKRGNRSVRKALVDANPELSPHLESRLNLLEAVFRATYPGAEDLFEEKPSTSEMSATIRSRKSEGDFVLQRPVDPKDVTSRGVLREATLRIRCPHCGNVVQLVDQQLQEVTCHSCGSSIQVDAEAALTDVYKRTPKFIGRFKVIRMLGQGAFGSVYLADDPNLDRTVALKVPRQGFFMTDDEEQRFFREAQSAAQLPRHPNIVQVHEVSQEFDTPFIVSEFIEGLTLSDLVSGGLLTFRETTNLMSQIARAVQHAHQKGVIHRDLKPSNILVNHEGVPFVSDFGLARRDDAEITMTMDGVILGTPAYMSPEQAVGKHDQVDARSDVYSLGVMLYKMLSRELPFNGTKRMLLQQVINDEPKSPRRLNEKIPRDLETITLKAMAKKPADRFQTARELADELERWMRGEPIQSRPVGRLTRVVRWCQRYPAFASMSAAILTLLVTIAVVFWWTARNEGKLREIADNRFVELTENSGNSALKQDKRFSAVINYAQLLKFKDNEIGRLRLGLIENQLPKLTSLLDVGADIKKMEFNRAGDRLLVATTDARLIVFDKRSGERLFEKKYEPFEKFSYNAILPNTPYVILHVSPETLEIWNYATSSFVRQMNFAGISSLTIDPSTEQFVTGTTSGEVTLWDREGQVISQIQLPGRLIVRSYFDPSSERIVILNSYPAKSGFPQTDRKLLLERRMAVWRPGQAKPDYVYSVESQVNAGRISNQGSRLFAATSSKLYSWDLVSGESRGEVAAIPNGFFARQICDVDGQNGKIRILFRNGIVETWDLDSEKEEKETNLRMNFGSQATVVSGSEELLAGASSEGFVRVHWMENGARIGADIGNSDFKPVLAFHPNNRELVVEAGDGLLFVWDLAGAVAEHTCYEFENSVNQAVFTPNGTRCLFACKDGSVRMVDSRTGRQIGEDIEHDASVYLLVVSPDGQYFVTSTGDGAAINGGESTIRVWRVEDGSLVGPGLSLDSAPVTACFSNDSSMFAYGLLSGETGVIRVAPNADSDVQPLFSHTRAREASRLAFSPDDMNLVSVHRDGKVFCLDIPSGAESFAPFSFGTMANHISFIGREQFVVAGPKGNIKFYEFATGSLVDKLKGTGGVRRLTFTPPYLLSAEYTGVGQLWESVDGKFQKRLELEHPSLSDAMTGEMDAQFQYVAICGKNKTKGVDQRAGAIVLWDAAGGDLLGPPFYHLKNVRTIDISPDGQQICSASDDKTGCLYRIPRNRYDVDLATDLIETCYSKGMAPELRMERYRTLMESSPEYFTVTPNELENWQKMLERWRKL